MFEEVNGQYFFPDVSDEDMKLIFTTRLPYAIKRSEPLFCDGTTNYKIVNIKRIEEPRKDELALFIRVDVSFHDGSDVANYYFRVYPNGKKER